MGIRQIKDQRTPGQKLPQVLDIPNRFHGGQIGVEHAQIDRGADEPQFILAEAVVLDDSVAIGIEHNANGRRQAVVWRDNQEGFHAGTMFGRVPAGGGETPWPWFNRLGKSTLTVVPFFSLLEMLRLPP